MTWGFCPDCGKESYNSIRCGCVEKAQKAMAEFERNAAKVQTKQASPLTFDQFQCANMKRCEEGFRHSVDNWSLLEWAGAAAGEMGEAANVCKKLKRQEQKVGGSWAARDPERAKLLSALADEIGDTLAYLSLLASAAGIDMGEAAARKFDYVSDKIKWPGERLSVPDEQTK